MNFLAVCLAFLVDLLKGQRRRMYELNIEIVLRSGIASYMLNEYQRLNCTRLRRFYAVYNSDLTKSPTNKDIADPEAYVNAYLCLVSTDSKNLRQNIPLLSLIQDPNYMLDKMLFDLDTIDWTQSYIFYPDDTIPNAQNGKSIMVIVGYEDTADSGKN